MACTPLSIKRSMERPRAVEVDAFAVGAERRDGVADDAVNVGHGVSVKKVGSVQAIGVLAQVLPGVVVESGGVALGPTSSHGLRGPARG
jgi:hypothetical protein